MNGNVINRAVSWFGSNPLAVETGTVISAGWSGDQYIFAIEDGERFIRIMPAKLCRFVMTEQEHKLAWNDYVLKVVKDRAATHERGVTA